MTSEVTPTGGGFIIRQSLVGHPACLEISGRNARPHLVHPQRPRHQREDPPTMDGREDERGGQALQAQLLQGVEEGVEPRLVFLDDAVRPVVRALRNQTTGVSRRRPSSFLR